jgi:hypothetical protein
MSNTFISLHLSEILSFLLLLHSYEFKPDILYIGGVESEEYVLIFFQKF